MKHRKFSKGDKEADEINLHRVEFSKCAELFYEIFSLKKHF